MNHARHRRDYSLRNALISLILLIACTLGALWLTSRDTRTSEPQTIQSTPEPRPAVTAPDVPLTYERTAVTTEPAVPVQAWTPEPQVVIPGIPAPAVGTPVTSSVGCQEDNPCWDCSTMGNRICSGTEATGQVCEEDMACWDCATMGNTVCGTVSEPLVYGDLEADIAAELDMAWATWDEVGASRGAVDDPNRPFRVDYMGVTPNFPENMVPGDLPLMGQDYQWYLFHVTMTDVPEETGHFEEPADMS